MSNEKEASSNHEGSVFVGHEHQVTYQREDESYLHEPRHEMVAGGVLTMDVDDHEYDGQGLQDLQPKYLEAFPDDLEKHCYQYIEVEEGKFLQLTVLEKSFPELSLINHTILTITIVISVRVPQRVLQCFYYF